MAAVATLTQYLALPGVSQVEGFEIPENPDAPHPTPYGDNPPAEWFFEPHPDVQPGSTGIITADGRFCAYAFEWDRCHNGFTDAGECWTPPRSASGNRYFMQSSVVTAEGLSFPVGVIPLWGGHAAPDLDIWAAMAHYDRPENVRVRARAVETEHGCVMCGAIVPGTTYRDVAAMRSSALSGDWRWVPELGTLDFLGPCFVARPGLPLGIEQAAVDAAFWDIARQLVASPATVRTATGEVFPRAVFAMPAEWRARSILTDNLPAAVIAAATQGGSMPQLTVTIPDGMPADLAQRAISATLASAQPGAAAASCGCGGASTPSDPHVPAGAIVPARVGKQAAAGTPFSYEELRDQVRAALASTFGGAGTDVWMQDWDDTWAVFELTREDAVQGWSEDTFMVGISIDADGAVTVQRDTVTEVVMVYAPAPAASTPMAASAKQVVTADADSALSEMGSRLDQIVTIVEGMATDIAGLKQKELDPIELTDELPQMPAMS